MKHAAVVVAAGRGKRFKSALPKQYAKFKGKEILAHAALAFERVKEIEAVVIVAAKPFIKKVQQDIVKKHRLKKAIAVIAGGEERFNSVKNALDFLKPHAPETVSIHDGARPFFNVPLLKKMIAMLGTQHAVIPVNRVFPTVKLVYGELVVKTLDREHLRTSHTPQCFRYDELCRLYDSKNIEKLKPTDEAYMFEAAGYKVAAVDDEIPNIKVTTKEDLKTLEGLYGGKS